MQIYITDKSCKKFWNTSVSFHYSAGELNNMKRHMNAIMAGARGYSFIHADTARIVQELDPGEQNTIDMTDDELLAELQA